MWNETLFTQLSKKQNKLPQKLRAGPAKYQELQFVEIMQ